MPEPGHTLKSAYGFMVCVAHDKTSVFRQLMRELYHRCRQRGLDRILIGFDKRDPLLKVASTYPHISYYSRLYLVEWPNGTAAIEQLDGRPVYVDIAML